MRNSRNEKPFRMKHLIALLFIMAIAFEVIYVYFGVDFLMWILGADIFGIAVAIFTSLKLPKETSKSQIEKVSIQGILNNASSFVKSMIEYAPKSGRACLAFVVAFLVTIASLSAHYRVAGKALDFIAGMRYTDNVSIQGEQANQNTDSTIHPPSNDEVPTDENQGVETENFLTNPNRHLQLSIEESQMLYFQHGLYRITDWSNSNSVEQTLLRYIEDIRSQEQQNASDGEVPQHIHNQIAQASNLEAVMVSSDELDLVIDMRMEAWEQYPKYSIAKLLAFNQQRYAIEYYKIKGEFSTIEYYYGQSVFWLYKSLAFSTVDEYKVKSILSCIQMRYHDIAFCAPYGSEVQQQASILSAAFETIIDDYL